jgi:hypothetical protein
MPLSRSECAKLSYRKRGERNCLVGSRRAGKYSSEDVHNFPRGMPKNPTPAEMKGFFAIFRDYASLILSGFMVA